MIPQFTPDINYTTPELVAQELCLKNMHDPNERFIFSDRSNPTYDYVCYMIRGNEDEIDRRTNDSWRPHYVKGEWNALAQYQHDELSWRSDYWKYGGNKIQLHPNILPWDPRPVFRHFDANRNIYYDHNEPAEGETDCVKIYDGDKVEFRSTLGGHPGGWKEVAETESSPILMPTNGFQIDYLDGVLYIRSQTPFRIYSDIRINYRYGRSYEEEVPYSVIRLCTLLTARDILNNQSHVIKVGGGGDLAGIKEQMLRGFDQKIGELWTTLQQPLAVYSMIQR